MNNQETQIQLNNDVLLADVMLRLTAIEQLLIDKAVITQDELHAKVNALTSQVVAALQATKK